eukprot:4138815-Alexandrium_andersonii.AAC.1
MASSRECACSVKSALVLAHSITKWQDALAALPLSPSNIVPRWPYLGICAASWDWRETRQEGWSRNCLVRTREE